MAWRDQESFRRWTTAGGPDQISGLLVKALVVRSDDEAIGECEGSRCWRFGAASNLAGL